MSHTEALSDDAQPAPTTAGDSSGASAQDVASRAGRGGVAVLGAKAFFILSGLVQQAGLQAALGKQEYGRYGLVFALTNIVNNVLVSGSTQGVSRVVAGSRGREPGALRGALRIHAPFALVIAVLFATVATPIYARFEHQPGLMTPLWVLSGVVLLYGLYAPLVGSLNGRGLFGKQAALDVLTMTLRTAGMIAFAFVLQRAAGTGVLGTAIGFLGAAGIVLVVAVRVAGTGRTEGSDVVRPSEYLRLLTPLLLAQLFVNLAMQADIMLLGRFLVEGAEAAGLHDSAATDAASAWVAVYRSCQLFAFLPYQLLLSLMLVLFPMLAHARAEDDAQKVKAYVSRGARVGVLATGALVGVIAGAPRSTLHFLYSADIAAEGAPVLRVLAVAQGVFGVLAIASTILASVGKERSSAALTLLALLASVASSVAVVPRARFGQAQLMASAGAVGFALVVALVVGAVLVRRATGAFVPLATGARVVVALACTMGLGSVIPPTGRVVSIVVSVALVVVYLVVLVILQELRRADLSSLADVLRRRARRR